MSEELRVDDLIVQNLTHARKVVADVLNIQDIAELADWVSVLSAMRGLPINAMDELGGPVIEKMFNSFGFDPKVKEHRNKMQPFQDIIALALQDCMQLLMQNMQRQQQAGQALRAGQGQLLT